MSDNAEKMKSFLDKIKAEAPVGSVSESKSGSIEFKFGDILPKTSLVFEESPDAEAEVSERLLNSEEEVTEKAVEENNSAQDQTPDVFMWADSQASAVNDISLPEDSEDEDGEFIIPDVFDLAAQLESQAPSTEDYVSTIWKAYAPRFTDVTENHYHFADTSALKEYEKKQAAKKVTVSADKEEEKKKSQVTVELRDARDVSRDSLDPTAEIIDHVPEAVVVNINGTEPQKKDTINVFKFSDVKREKTAEEISAEELAKQEISNLTGHKWVDKPEEASIESENPITDFVSQIEEEQDELSLNRETLADELPKVPIKLERHDKEYLPAGINEKNSKGASYTGEYNSFSMRDLFKDKFLDSIMAVRIRLLMAILLGFATVVFDIFKDGICDRFGMAFNFGAPAIIDACLIVSMFLISLPETAKAFKQLVFGSVVSELTSFISGVAIFAYTISMAVIKPVGANYPLLASVYAVMVVNSVFATYCLHYSHFSAFKVVSEKGIKSIIDKPLTRTLELENIALDGKIDEYKSKTARVFKTTFVSNFCENSKKNEENTKNNLLVLAIGFGIAVVMALIILFVVDVVAAMASFAIVVSLSMPAFSILSHKLPYGHIQQSATKDGSAVIGEGALYDFSDVDVIAFEDTEVFGPDDVTLKSASDRRSDYLDSMKKMASLFEALGGPLCRVFESALNKKYAPAENVVIEDDGAEGIVDGKLVMAGTAEYMNRHGIRIPSVGNYRVGSTKIIYAAADGEFFATFTVNYSFSEEFALMLSAMREEGIVPLVYTRDFNINNDFMRFLTGNADVIRVIRKYTPAKETSVYGKINSAMVTKGDKTSVLSLILSAKRYTKFQSFVSVGELTASAAGAALAVAIIICNMTFSLPGVFVALWQFGWSAVLGFMSKRTFNILKKDRKDADE